MTGNTEGTVKQYLNGSKESRRFMAKARKILQEELAQQGPQAKPPLQWDLLFATEEEVRRVDRASRAVNAESFAEFCRQTLLERADEILGREKSGMYPRLATLESSKVAEEDLD